MDGSQFGQQFTGDAHVGPARRRPWPSPEFLTGLIITLILVAATLAVLLVFGDAIPVVEGI